MSNLNLYQKIYNVMNESEAIEKSMVVGSGNNSYKAVSEASMLNLVKPLFKKHKLIIFPIEGDIKDNVMTWEKTDAYKGTSKQDLRAITELKVFYKIVDVESGESEIIVGFGNGADPQDKGAGKAFTYSFKNALSKTFMLFSGEDTDNTHSDDINKDKEDKKSGQANTPKDNKKPPTTTTDTKNAISDEQIEELFLVASSKGYTNGEVKSAMLTKYKVVELAKLTKEQYETAVKGYENAPKKEVK